jgi:hypothetical protein
MSTGWIIGYVVAGALIVVVVVLLLLMIRGAHRAAVKAESILEALEASRDNTEPLWAVDDVNRAVERITAGASAVRQHLTAKSGGST